MPRPNDRRTAFYIQYWLTSTIPEDGEMYLWPGPEDRGAYKGLNDAQRAASLDLEEKKPEAYDIQIYSQEEQWLPEEEDPRFGCWHAIECTITAYDRRGEIIWSDIDQGRSAKGRTDECSSLPTAQ